MTHVEGRIVERAFIRFLIKVKTFFFRNEFLMDANAIRTQAVKQLSYHSNVIHLISCARKFHPWNNIPAYNVVASNPITFHQEIGDAETGTDEDIVASLTRGLKIYRFPS